MITIDLSSQEAQIVDLENIDHISTLPQIHPQSQLHQNALKSCNHQNDNGESESIEQEEYRPESESDVSSERTVNYKRHRLRLREVLAICEDEFYRKGRYSGIYRIKRDQEEIARQKKEQMPEEKHFKREEGFRVRQKKEQMMRSRKKEEKQLGEKRKFICKADRIAKLQFKRDIAD